jgi:hypothetical protein
MTKYDDNYKHFEEKGIAKICPICHTLCDSKIGCTHDHSKKYEEIIVTKTVYPDINVDFKQLLANKNTDKVKHINNTETIIKGSRLIPILVALSLLIIVILSILGVIEI